MIPAGVILSPDYWQKLAAIDWHGLFYEEGSEGIPFFLELKERIKKEFDPDFLLIDSRTGITEMSGLCTSLLADKVVFLIVNNQENIEGARQILQSIQKAERFPGQKPIEVTFALARIPSPKEEKERELEKHIVKDIQDFLNEPVEDLQSQLNIEAICILHSDRELELAESLRISREGVTKETPLFQGYLRLFSKIVPEEVIEPKLGSILNEIPQKELEGIAAIYPHPKSLEKIIDFYIPHGTGREKILGAFHELWKTFGIDNQETLSKYASLFMKWSLSRWDVPSFELAIIERYLELSPENRIAVEKRLAEAYKNYYKSEMALKHYFRLLEEVGEKNEILGEILDIYIKKKSYDDAKKLFEKYSDIIDSDASLRLKKVEVMFKTGKVEETRKLLDDDGVTERNLFDKKVDLYFNVMERLGKSDEANKKLNMMLNEGLRRGNSRRIYEVGQIFYRLGKGDEFENKISGKHPEAADMLSRLDRKYSLDRKYRRDW